MNIARSAGVLLHPTSLPGRYGIGDLGDEAFNFVNFLHSSGQTLWQVFPLGPTGYGDSPYQCFSAFAGNPLLISPDKLLKEGLLQKTDVEHAPQSNPHRINYEAVTEFKYGLLAKAYQAFKNDGKKTHAEFDKFCTENAEWLDNYALFTAVKTYHEEISWTEWEPDIALRKKGALEVWTSKLKDEINFIKFIQYLFFKQWAELKKYANSKGVKIIGDIPIFVAYDSADVWANKELFTVKEDGELEFIAGVPPDYFSATGQRWGNPLYKWEVMEKDDFLWWRKRFAYTLKMVDIIRIDHFRGFEAFWKIPAESPTAETGKWVKAPGAKLFESVKRNLGDLPILAEDLGVITKEVEALRDQFNFPGMKILQFAFGMKMEHRFLPHNHTPNSVVYTGSHDNDTTRAYFEKAKHDGSDIYAFTQEYLNYYGDDMRFALIKAAYSSVANIVIIPMQDMLNLGSDARMNFPGTVGGNWNWRFTWNQVYPEMAAHYKRMTVIYERPKIKKD
jgi:4-alpha-glucanotransferase